VGIEMPDAQLGHLAGGSADRSLVTLAAGLGIVEGAESIGSDVLNFLEKFLVGKTTNRIGKSVALVVESGRCFGRLCGRLGCQAEQDTSCDQEQ